MNATVLVDMFGCPNRCRHCWLGHGKNRQMSIDDYLWIAEQFRNHFNELYFYSWYKEPDYADNYRELWDLDVKLSDSKPTRHELASIWRMARDETYAPWLKSLGVNAVQTTLFGGEENTDYFTGRKGAFKDILTAFE
ncbi:MAG: radical SAM protein [Oscillospiraceae bacterium]|nr:radical SAM protein [Oscillospiraceae bacterium]